MIKIERGIPALVKYSPVISGLITPASREWSEHLNACIHHGMKYGKTEQKAWSVETRTFELCSNLRDYVADAQHGALHAIRTNYAESSVGSHLYGPYLKGVGVEIGSGGWPMSPSSIQVELPEEEYAMYNSGNQPEYPIQIKAHDWRRYFAQRSLDYVSSSHLLEDFRPEDQKRMMREWIEMIRPGGHLVILVPEINRWRAAIAAGQPPNCAHKHELGVGELSQHCDGMNVAVIYDGLAFPNDPKEYTIVFVARVL